jgi:hypothetical protein
VIDDPDALNWRISTFSGSGADCVAVAPTGTDIAMRNSNHPADGLIRFPGGPFGVLLTAIREGQADDFA